MKKLILCVVVLLSFCVYPKAQTPQFAVVKPDGTSQVYTSWASAYLGALDGDYIYLPGMEINVGSEDTINKSLHIFGAGHHPDSTSVTGETVINGPLYILGHGSSGSIEGIKLQNIMTLGGTNKLNDYMIKRCFLKGLVFTSPNSDSLPENTLVTESIISVSPNGSNGISGGGHNALFTKNIITCYVWGFQYCTFKNNIFTAGNPGYMVYTLNYISHSTIENNIFIISDPAPSSAGNCYNLYRNNLKIDTPNFSGSESCPASQDGNISVPAWTDIFITYAGSGFQYSDNYHLKPTCPGVGAGTDGHDVGIYGTNNPTVEGWVPSNPHIYFKQVDSETGSDGKLHIQVGVRANNQ